MSQITKHIPVSFNPHSEVHEFFSSSRQYGQNIQPFLHVFGIAILCVFVWKTLVKRVSQFFRKVRLIEQLNGPTAYPIIGNAPHMIFTDFYEWTSTMCKKWGDPLRLWRLHHPMVYISTYKVANQLLSKPHFNGKLIDLELIRRMPGGRGLSTSPPEESAQRRKLLHKGFTKSTVENLVPIISDGSKKLVKHLQQHADTGEDFNLMEPVMASAFHIVCRCCFGEDIMNDITDSEALEHMNALHTFANNFGKRILSPNLLYRSDWIFYNYTAIGKETMTCINFVNDFARRAINKRRAQRLASKEKEFISENNNTKVPLYYLDLLLDLEKEGAFQDLDIIGELNNFIVGAYDAVALTVMWALLALSMNPSHQNLAVEELDQLFGSDNSANNLNITANDTKNLKYLELCVKETLRLYPTAPVFPRSAPVDVQLDDGRIIPGGTDVMIMVNMINREEEYFPQPNEFKPERHFKQIRQFMPFSAGNRNCIGQIHAMYMVKVITAYLLKEFRWESTEKPENIKCRFQALLFPENGITYKIFRRNNNSMKSK
ncbi:unnamed protein product [Orchesella dallaii]|uniref:Cytochrome P450 4C1 n=1 Tax=Orchesella dallaii TaxID=48710 RepID=A0ABP1RAB8_9HEXA